MRIVVNVLAVIGAVAIVAVLALAIWFWQVSSPAGEVATPTASPTASAPVTPPAQVNEGQVWASDTQIDATRLLTSAGLVEDVVITANGVRAGEGATQADSVQVVARVPFATVEQQVGNNIAMAHDGQGRVQVTAPLEVLGRVLTVSGVGQVRADGDHIVIWPVSFDLPGLPDLGGTLGDLARQVLTVREPVPGLPRGLQLTAIEVRDDGFHVVMNGEQVTLAPSG